jgi:hypothetical protein
MDGNVGFSRHHVSVQLLVLRHLRLILLHNLARGGPVSFNVFFLSETFVDFAADRLIQRCKLPSPADKGPGW